jgi:adsorption protein B
MDLLDGWVTACLLPLALWVLASGLDDLCLDVTCVWRWIRRRPGRTSEALFPPETALKGTGGKRIAVFVPLWQEHAVIARMLRHNVAAIRYRNYHFFVGAYPNDQPTVEAVRRFEDRFPHVHLALCPHDGPTSKADCLNWIYQRMLLFEEARGVRFEVVVLHDAEDVIHPDSLGWINHFTDTYDMVQIPVLPVATSFWSLTHGVYCEEFAEFQTKDIPARQVLGGFLPSNGVGTGYRRSALEKLAVVTSNRLFDPQCLTEDYETGLRLHRLHCSQIFVPIRFVKGEPVATREIFPEDFGSAVRQRTRWVTGIALQSWEKYGWGTGAAQLYWFWRDRKGLIGNPVSFAVNLLFGYGLVSWGWSRANGEPWAIGEAAGGAAGTVLLGATLALQGIRMCVRAGCAARIYGPAFALCTPLRALWGNCINFWATACAVHQYAVARLAGRPLVWIKTEHAFPSRAALLVREDRNVESSQTVRSGSSR